MTPEPFSTSTASVIYNSIIMVINEGNTSSSSPGYNNNPTSPSLTTQPPTKVTCFIESVTSGISQAEIITVSVMILLFSIFGCLGNGLVLYVFSKKSDKVTSTIFILALAWTDFFTCLIFMPFTATFLLLHSRLYYSFFCKLYHFLNTSNVPLSAFIMVAIAVDRYFSICHPFMRVVTPRRARISILCLVLIASVLGSITACLYSTRRASTSPEANATTHDNLFYNNNSGVILQPSSNYNDMSLTQEPDSLPVTSQTFTDLPVNAANNTSSRSFADHIGATLTTVHSAQVEASSCATVNIGTCVITEDIFSMKFTELYQKIYISFYIVSLLAVFTLYFFIYRSVAERRAWRRKQKSWSHSPMTMTAGVTDVDDINKGDDIFTGEGDNLELSPQNNSSNMSPSNSKESGSGDSAEMRIESGNSVSTTTTNMASLPRNCSHENGVNNTMLSPSAEKKINRERRDFNFLANIRTALMLFVVTLVFIISFLPAWLMATNIISFEIIIFYTHFVYNVANPVIYAFMNQSFRKELKRVFQRVKFHCFPPPFSYSSFTPPVSGAPTSRERCGEGTTSGLKPLVFKF